MNERGKNLAQIHGVINKDVYKTLHIQFKGQRSYLEKKEV